MTHLFLAAMLSAGQPAAATPPAASPAAPAPTAAAAEEPKVCKRVRETGSFVRATRVCLTREEWERSARGHSDYARDLQESLRSRTGGQ